MYAYDFEYDGKNLSEFGMIVCEFGGSTGAQKADKGAQIEFSIASANAGKKNTMTGSRYEDRLSTTFQICKDPEVFDDAHMEITDEEFRALSRWLNRREFLWFHSFDWCEPEKERPWFRASFTLTRVNVGRATYGVELEMVTDSPFGYGKEIEETFNFTSGSLTKTLADQSDEIGEIYPDMTITCKAGGKLTLSNAMTGCSFSVDNCVNGEVITQIGDSMIITTSSTTHKVASDFNYDWFCIANEYDNRENAITASLPCSVTLRYRPFIKDTL